jgi:heme-degrading monooxygenase HmoA
MYARVTLLEIDPVRTDVASAVALFREHVLPDVRRQPGYAGVYVLATEEGKGLLLSLWETPEEADAQAGSGWYAETLSEHMTLFRSPPGRERYEVVVADVPVTV